MSLSNHYQAISCTSSEQLIIDDNGGLRSCRFDDIYYNPGQGAEECQHVFLDGNQLQQRWQQASDSDHFVIAETGFGTGLNFLACWDLWRKAHAEAQLAQAPKTLYFYTTELYPLTRSALEKSIQHYNPFPELAEALVSQYPDPIGGEYLLNFDSNSDYPVKLIMLLGDTSECLGRLEHYPSNAAIECDKVKGDGVKNDALNVDALKVDAWFLDGYAPSKNPDMWQETLFTLMARHSKDSTTVATFSVARQVRDQLSDNGFVICKRKGFGRKRDMLTARFDSQKAASLISSSIPSPIPSPTKQPIKTPTKNNKHSRKSVNLSGCYYRFGLDTATKNTQRHAMIIGAGIAGCTIAYKLAQRGWQVSLIDAEKNIASAASGNARAVLYARTAQQRSSLADLHEAAFHYATRFYRGLDDKNLTAGLNGMLKLDEQLSGEMLALNPEAYSRNNISAEQASELCGIAMQHNGIHYPESGWLDPSAICQALTEHPNIQFCGETNINALHQVNGGWRAECHNNTNSREANIAIVTSGQLSHQFEQTAWLPLRSMRGQTTALPQSTASSCLTMAVCQRGYITPASNNSHSVGATYAIKDSNSEVTRADHQTNIENIVAMLDIDSPWRQELNDLDTHSIGKLEGRVGFRCVAPDYLPIVGPIPMVDSFNEKFASLKKDAKQTPQQLATLQEGLYVSTGFGSHGYTTAPLAAEILLAQIEGTPMPIGDKLRQSIAPARFLVRQLIRSN